MEIFLIAVGLRETGLGGKAVLSVVVLVDEVEVQSGHDNGHCFEKTVGMEKVGEKSYDCQQRGFMTERWAIGRKGGLRYIFFSRRRRGFSNKSVEADPTAAKSENERTLSLAGQSAPGPTSAIGKAHTGDWGLQPLNLIFPAMPMPIRAHVFLFFFFLFLSFAAASLFAFSDGSRCHPEFYMAFRNFHMNPSQYLCDGE